MIGSKLWTRWYEYARDEPGEALRPVRVADEHTAFEIVAMDREQFPGLVTLVPWRIEHLSDDDRREFPRAYVQPGPYLMAPTLTAARTFLPRSATLLPDVPLIARYIEAWLL